MNMSDLKINSPICLSLSLLFGLLIGYLDFYAPEVQPAVLLLLIVTGAMGFLNPACAWRLALLTGIGIPVVNLYALSQGVKPSYSIKGQWAIWLLPQIPSFIGAYSGVLFHQLITSK